MRVSAKKNPHALFKKGLVRQGFKHSVTKKPVKMASSTYFRPKRLSTPVGGSLKYKKKKEKTFRKVDCGCGCQGNK